MLWLNRALRFVLRKVVSRLPASTHPENSPENSQEFSETLPTELHRIVARHLEALETKIQAEEFADIKDKDTEPSLTKTRKFLRRKVGDGVSWFTSSKPRMLAAGAVVLTASVGLACWYWPASAPESSASNEELFRQLHGMPLVRIAYVSDWPSSVAAAYLNAELIRTEMDAEVLFKPVSLANLRDAWSMLSQDKADVFLSAWLPSQADMRMDAGEKVEMVGKVTADARLGIAVPAWMPFTSIEDLTRGDFDFGGKIYGIDHGSRLNALLRRAIEDYDIRGVVLEEKSERFMLEHLRAAMRDARPIVVAAWSPHALFGEFRLKFLDDPRGVFGKPESVNVAVSREFAAGFENICRFLRRQKLTSAQFSDLIYRTRNSQTLAEDVKKWIADNRPLVEGWLKTASAGN